MRAKISANRFEEFGFEARRFLSESKKKLLFVLNMTPMERKDYRVGVPQKKKYKLILNSDDKRFGGDGHVIPEVIAAEKEPCDYRDYSISFDLPPYSSAIFAF